MFSPCSPKRRASDKYLPVCGQPIAVKLCCCYSRNYFTPLWMLAFATQPSEESAFWKGCTFWMIDFLSLLWRERGQPNLFFTIFLSVPSPKEYILILKKDEWKKLGYKNRFIISYSYAVSCCLDSLQSFPRTQCEELLQFFQSFPINTIFLNTWILDEA